MQAIARKVASQTTGRYDFTLIPVLLPTKLLESLLTISPTSNAKGWTFCEHAELGRRGIENEVDVPGEGLQWAVLHAGEHLKSGVQWLPGGSVNFYETKIEIPFLKPIDSSATHPATTLKSIILFSSALMTHSASLLSGLKSSHEKFDVVKRNEPEKGKESIGFERYEVVHWLVVERVDEGTMGEGDSVAGWSAKLSKENVGGYWIAEKGGDTINRFHLTSATPPRQIAYKIKLNLSRFFPSLPLPEIESILDQFTVAAPDAGTKKRFVVDEDGWLVFFAKSWDLNEEFYLESMRMGSL